MDGEQTQGHSESSLDLIYDEIKDRVAAQVEHFTALDRKAELVLGSSSLIITIGAGLTAIGGAAAAINHVPAAAGYLVVPTTTLSVALFVIAFAFYIAAMVLAFRAYTLTEFHEQVPPARLREKYLPMEPDEARHALMANLVKAFEQNEKTITARKVPALNWALYCLLGETLSLAVGLMLSAV